MTTIGIPTTTPPNPSDCHARTGRHVSDHQRRRLWGRRLCCAALLVAGRVARLSRVDELGLSIGIVRTSGLARAFGCHASRIAAARLERTTRQAREGLRHLGLEEPVGEREALPALAREVPAPDEALVRQEALACFRAAIMLAHRSFGLTARGFRALRLHAQGWTLRSIGRRLGVTGPAVCQLEKRSIRAIWRAHRKLAWSDRNAEARHRRLTYQHGWRLVQPLRKAVPYQVGSTWMLGLSCGHVICQPEESDAILKEWMWRATGWYDRAKLPVVRCPYCPAELEGAGPPSCGRDL